MKDQQQNQQVANRQDGSDIIHIPELAKVKVKKRIFASTVVSVELEAKEGHYFESNYNDTITLKYSSTNSQSITVTPTVSADRKMVTYSESTFFENPGIDKVKVCFSSGTSQSDIRHEYSE